MTHKEEMISIGKIAGYAGISVDWLFPLISGIVYNAL